MPIVRRDEGSGPDAHSRRGGGRSSKSGSEVSFKARELEAGDLLEWNETAQTCVSLRWRQPVLWASTQCKGSNAKGCGGSLPMEPPKCCTFETLLAARWHQLLQRPPPYTRYSSDLIDAISQAVSLSGDPRVRALAK